jgi:hypothetical protein
MPLFVLEQKEIEDGYFLQRINFSKLTEEMQESLAFLQDLVIFFAFFHNIRRSSFFDSIDTFVQNVLSLVMDLKILVLRNTEPFFLFKGKHFFKDLQLSLQANV